MKKIILLLLIVLATITTYAQTVQTMYWVGGTGDWKDINHWSFQSGTRDPLNAPSSIPTSTTHVIFDYGSGLSGSSTARTVTISDDNYTIASLTFADNINQGGFLKATSKVTINTGNQNLYVLGDVKLQPFVFFNSAGNNGRGLYVNPPNGVTTTLNYNGGEISSVLTAGEGILNILGNFTAGSYFRMSSGTVNHSASLLTGYFNSISGGAFNAPNATSVNVAMLSISGGTVNMPNVTNFNAYGAILNSGGYTGLVLTGTAILNLPICTTMNITNDIHIGSSNVFSLPALQTLTVRNVGGAGSLYLPNGALVTANSWGYVGTINANNTEFTILNGSFYTKDGSVIQK